MFGRDLEHWFQAESELLHPAHVDVAETEKEVAVRAEVPDRVLDGRGGKDADVDDVRRKEGQHGVLQRRPRGARVHPDDDAEALSFRCFHQGGGIGGGVALRDVWREVPAVPSPHS